MLGAWWDHGNAVASNQKSWRSHVALYIHIKRLETYFSRHIIPLYQYITKSSKFSWNRPYSSRYSRYWTGTSSQWSLILMNRPFPSSLVPLFQNESKCETFHMKMSSACSFIFMQIKVIFIRMVSHLDSLWNRGTRELGNGLFHSRPRGHAPFGRHKDLRLWEGPIFWTCEEWSSRILDFEHAQNDGKFTDFRCWNFPEVPRGCASWCWPKGARPLERRMEEYQKKG